VKRFTPLCILLLLAAGPVRADPTLFLDPQFPVQTVHAIVYGQGAVQPPAPTSVDLLLDLYRPIGPGVPPALPGLLLIHGGGFTSGSRSQAQLVEIAEELASRGYVVASIDYRLLGDDPILSPGFEAMLGDASNPSSPTARAAIAGIEDALAAHQWLIANATSWSIDPSRIAVGGGSAGAIIAVELAIALDDHGILGAPSPAAVIDLWGMAWPLPASDLESGEPPIFSVHGELDTRVPFAQAVALRDRALQVGVPFEFHPIPGAGHGFAEIDVFAVEAEPGVTLFDRAVEFLWVHLELAPAAEVPALSSPAAAVLIVAIACFAARRRKRRAPRAGSRAAPLRRVAILVGCGLALACGGPLGPFRGGRLAGPERLQPAEDWSFTSEVMLVQLETRPDAPWSVTLGCIDHEGALYVGADDPSDRWVHHVVADPRVRVRVQGKVYPRIAVKVTDPVEWMVVGKRLFAKYDLSYAPDHEPGWLFRLDPPPAPAN